MLADDGLQTGGDIAHMISLNWYETILASGTRNADPAYTLEISPGCVTAW
jgi:hypothetical protein